MVFGFVIFSIFSALLFYQHEQAEDVGLRTLRQHVSNLAVAAALMVDGDTHREVVRANDAGGPAYRSAVAPLITFHNALPDLFYVYTMVEVDGAAFYVLDTAEQPGLDVPHDLEASALLEPFETEPGDDWLDRVAADGVYVNPGFETDDYGTFVSGHALIRAADGSVAGFSGVDVDMAYFVAWQRQNRIELIVDLTIGAALSLGIGFGAYHLLWKIDDDARRLEQASLTDPLTGAWNRRAFELRLDADFKRFRRSGVNSTIAMIDADRFKPINDAFGHEGGDRVLRRLVDAMRDTLRETDFIARWGGDEFVAVLTETTTTEGMAISNRLQAALSELDVEMPTGDAVGFTISIGLSEYRADDDGPEHVLARADTALYAAKESGRNQLFLHTAAE